MVPDERPASADTSTDAGAQTIGGLHHIASVVADIEAAATYLEGVLGWRRMLEERASGAEAQQWCRTIGIEDAVDFRLVMLEPPDGTHVGRVEFIQFDTRRGPGHILYPSLHVSSYRVRDIERTWRRAMDLGGDPITAPRRADVGPWSGLIASYRQVGGGIVELIQL